MFQPRVVSTGETVLNLKWCLTKCLIRPPTDIRGHPATTVDELESIRFG